MMAARAGSLVLFAAVVVGAEREVTVVSTCEEEPIWIVNTQDESYRCPEPNSTLLFSGQMQKLNYKDQITFKIPDGGLPSTFFSAAAGCDDQTGACDLGQSKYNVDGLIEPNDPLPWGPRPALDTKAEITFGCVGDDPRKCTVNPSAVKQGKVFPDTVLSSNTYFDISAVDGFSTFPVTLTPDDAECKAQLPTEGTQLSTKGLFSVGKPCPAFPFTDGNRKQRSVNLLATSREGLSLGCASPCMRFKLDQRFFDEPLSEDAPELKDIVKYACCTNLTSDECVGGTDVGEVRFTMLRSRYVSATQGDHHVYGFAYGDNPAFKEKVSFSCASMARRSFTISFGCPVRQNIPTPSPPTGPVGCNAAGTSLPGKSCCTFWPESATQKSEPCASAPGGSCPDCRANIVAADKNAGGSYNCLCHKGEATAAPPRARPAWFNPTACPLPSPPAPPAPTGATRAGPCTAHDGSWCCKPGDAELGSCLVPGTTCEPCSSSSGWCNCVTTVAGPDPCKDKEGWTDRYGDGCGWYQDRMERGEKWSCSYPIVLLFAHPERGHARDACCACNADL